MPSFAGGQQIQAGKKRSNKSHNSELANKQLTIQQIREFYSALRPVQCGKKTSCCLPIA